MNKEFISIFRLITIFLFSLSTIFSATVKSQTPNPALIGYWHNWTDASAPYIQLDQVDSRYNVIEVSFAVPTSTSDMTMTFTPDPALVGSFTTKIQSLQSQGKKVLISIGGATSTIDLSTTTNKNNFITSMTNIINTYGFDGLDLDIENGNSVLISNGGTISAPKDSAIIHLIAAVKQIMSNYRSSHLGKKMFLTLAPETAYVQGGMSAYGSIWGSYLPTIQALCDSIDILQVQLYNSGTMYGLDGKIYTQGTADFIVAMTEAVIKGFSTSGGTFSGLPASKVAVGLPACPSAAGGGFTNVDTVKSALDYLLGKGSKPGSYTLVQASGYPDLRGMMTWSINWDNVSTCNNSAYQYAANFIRIFDNINSISNLNISNNEFEICPNPGKDKINIRVNDFEKIKSIFILNANGERIQIKLNLNESIDISEFPSGLYILQLTFDDETIRKKFIVQH